MKYNIPSEFKKTILSVHGDKGHEWLSNLPTLLEQCEEQLKVNVLQPFALSYNYVASCTTLNGEEVVLKLGVPSNEFTLEIEALSLFKGKEVVKVLDGNKERGFLLLEKLNPGTMLSNVHDDTKATKVAADLLKNFWKPEPTIHQFPSIAQLAKGLQRLRKNYKGETGPLPASYVEKAELVFSELLSTNKRQLLLHGDFHHYNIIQSSNVNWKIIDPKGVIGEPEYEVATYLKNELLNKSNPIGTLKQRIRQFVNELHLEEERVLKWGFCQSVLSACWCVEDGVGDWSKSITIASFYEQLLKEYLKEY